MNAEVTDLIAEGGRIVGVKARRAPRERSRCGPTSVVRTDGRSSTVRDRAGMKVEDFGVPIDVLWFRIPKSADDPASVLGRIKGGTMLVTLDRGDYFQCALIIRKGTFEEIRERGLAAFQATIADAAPFLRDRMRELDDWEKVKLLTVQINRLPTWHRPGLLLIGDAAHAMSPAGGVGINLAVQDAVAAANRLAAPLRERRLTAADLQAIQHRREMPVRRIQAGQVFVHRRMFSHPGQVFSIPWPARALLVLCGPLVRRLAARIVGVGFRPEKIETGVGV